MLFVQFLTIFMALCYVDPNQEIGYFYGNILVDEFSDLLSVSVYDQVQSDLGNYLLGVPRFIAQTRFRMFIKVTEFDATIMQQYGGSLARSKIGAYTMQNADYNYPVQFITYGSQTSDSYSLLVTELPNPTSILFEECALIFENTRVWSVNPQANDPVAYTYATDIIFQPSEGVKLSVFITYAGFFNSDPTGGSQVDLLYLNF